MKKLILIICLVVLGAITVNAAVPKEAAGDKAEVIVETMADEALEFLKAQKVKGWDNKVVEKKFSDLLNKYFNVEYIGKASLGIYWKKASGVEKKAYLKVFKENIVKVYTIRFEEYTDQIIEIEKSSVRGRGDVIVFTKIVSGDGEQPPLDVDWRVRLQKDGSYRVIDLTVGGVSMLITQKNEYAAIIEQNGGRVQALIDELEDVVANN